MLRNKMGKCLAQRIAPPRTHYSYSHLQAAGWSYPLEACNTPQLLTWLVVLGHWGWQALVTPPRQGSSLGLQDSRATPGAACKCE